MLFRTRRTTGGEIPPRRYISTASFSAVFGLLLCLGAIVWTNVPAPGRFPDHGGSTHAISMMTARCLLLAYPGHEGPDWFPYAVELQLRKGPYSSPEAVSYDALGWWPDATPKPGSRWQSDRPLGGRVLWAYAGRDSIDIEWHHSPVLRVPIAGDVALGRGGYRTHYSLADAFLEDEFVVRATRIFCGELPR